jgi:hypothetical protein
VLTDLLLHVSATRPVIRALADVRADLPLPTELARLPISALVPTADLPLWLAVAQLLVVVGLGELLFARRLVVLVAVAGHILPTLAARWMLDLGPANLLGLPRYLAAEIDTGPSALTTAVGGFLLVRCGARRTAVLLGTALLLADRISPGLDGREHLLALIVGVVAAVLLARHDRAEAAAPIVPALRLRWAVGTLSVATLGLVALGAYHPIRASAAPLAAAPGGRIRAFEVLDAAHLPIVVGRLPAGVWLADGPSCEHPHGRPATSVWRRPRWLCSDASPWRGVVLHYRVAGVRQSQHLR